MEVALPGQGQVGDFENLKNIYLEEQVKIIVWKMSEDWYQFEPYQVLNLREVHPA